MVQPIMLNGHPAPPSNGHQVPPSNGHLASPPNGHLAPPPIGQSAPPAVRQQFGRRIRNGEGFAPSRIREGAYEYESKGYFAALECSCVPRLIDPSHQVGRVLVLHFSYCPTLLWTRYNTPPLRSICLIHLLSLVTSATAFIEFRLWEACGVFWLMKSRLYLELASEFNQGHKYGAKCAPISHEQPTRLRHALPGPTPRSAERCRSRARVRPHVR